MSSTNKTTYYELSQYVGTDKPTYLGDYNSDMLAIDTAIHTASENASTALSTANSADSTATTASTNASTAVTTANEAKSTAETAQTTANTASTNASAALVAANSAVATAEANPITNLAPAYDATLTYAVGDLVTYDGKLYKCVVAVTSAMAFNLNYWDDVTASTTFRTNNVIFQLTVSNVTVENALTQIYNGISSYFNNGKLYILEMNAPDITRQYMMIFNQSIGMSFSRANINSNNLETQIAQFHITNNINYILTTISSLGTVTVASHLSDVLGSDITFKVLEL